MYYLSIHRPDSPRLIKMLHVLKEETNKFVIPEEQLIESILVCYYIIYYIYTYVSMRCGDNLIHYDTGSCVK